MDAHVTTNYPLQSPKSLKSKIGLAASKAAALRIDLNIQGCGIVAAPVHAPSHAPLLLPLLLSHNIPRSTCPPLSPHANSFVIGTAVINTHTLNKTPRATLGTGGQPPHHSQTTEENEKLNLFPEQQQFVAGMVTNHHYVVMITLYHTYTDSTKTALSPRELQTHSKKIAKTKS